MNDNRSTSFEQFLEAERQFHELMPIKASYSKIFFRTLLWFAIFSLVYMLVTGL